MKKRHKMARSTIKPAGGYQPRTCPWCQGEYIPTRHDQTFCTKAHREENANFEAARGKLLYRAIYHWQVSGGRMGKAPKGCSLGEISRVVRDEMIAVDKRMGRLPPPLPNTER